ncbi:MAG: hypothetical protein WCJ11_08760 [Methylococcaceae bacterium]
MSFNISSTSISTSIYNTQTTNQVATVNSSNLANNAANQSAFSSYIGQAFAQIGVANPTNASAPVVSGANKTSAKEQESQKSVSTFIQDLFSILSNPNTAQKVATSVTQQSNSSPSPSQNNGQKGNQSSDSDINQSAVAAYNAENSTTVGNIVTNLKTLVNQLNSARQDSQNNNAATIQALQNGFQSILDAQGASASSNKTTLGGFLQTLAQNLQGQSPLGIIINTEA